MDEPASEALSALGEVVRIRAVRASDEDALRALNERVSDRTIYLRYFSASRAAAERDLDRVVRPAGEDHASAVAIIAGELVAVAGFERTGPGEAEVALLVDDARQGQGVGTLLLEHLASIARRHGIRTFVAETLPQNHRMLGVFSSSGLASERATASGVVEVRLSTELDAAGLEAVDARERAADVRSLQPLVAPRAVAVVGAGSSPGGVGHEVVRSLQRSGYPGTIMPVNASGDPVRGLDATTSVADCSEPVDLAIVAVPTDQLLGVLDECGAAGVRAAAVLSAIPAEPAGDGNDLRHELLRTARLHGMRVLGPGCIGVLSNLAEVRLDATFARSTPPPGALAVASQSGGVGAAVLDLVSRTGVGVAAFLSLGDKIDISGNDTLMLWGHDDRVAIIALFLESIGNPRKFARLARDVGRGKPVVLLLTRGTDEAVVEVICEQAGLIRVSSLEELVDVAAILAQQPLPPGGRLAIVSNASGIGRLAADAAAVAGLDAAHVAPASAGPRPAVPNLIDLGSTAGPDEYRAALAGLAADPDVDVVAVLLAVTAVGDPEHVVRVVAEAAERGDQTTVLVVVGGELEGPPTAVTGFRLPVLGLPERAVRALGHVVRYARWRRSGPGRVMASPSGAADAGLVIENYLQRAPDGGWLGPDEVAGVLSPYGAALPAAASLEHRLPLVIGARGDTPYGPVVYIGLGGPTGALLGGRVFRAAPLSDTEARRMMFAFDPVRELVASARAHDVDPLVDLVQRVARLAADQPDIARVELDPVIVTDAGLTVGAARVRVRRPDRGRDPDLRTLRA